MQRMDRKDPMVTASNVYQSLNENEHARVLKVTFNPGDTAKMHHHPDHMIYVIKGGRLKLTSGDKTDMLDLAEGSVVFLQEQEHEATNPYRTTVELLVVEFKK